MENLRSKIILAFTLEVSAFWLILVLNDLLGDSFTVLFVWYALTVIANSVCIFLLLKYKPRYYAFLIFIGLLLVLIPLLLSYVITHIKMC
ncbi:MAG: hypothetical protein QM710_04355 [Flavobacterium sp.]